MAGRHLVCASFYVSMRDTSGECECQLPASQSRAQWPDTNVHAHADRRVDFSKISFFAGVGAVNYAPSRARQNAKIPSAWARGGVSPELPRTTGAQPNQGDFLNFFFIFFDIRRPQVEQTPTCDSSRQFCRKLRFARLAAAAS